MMIILRWRARCAVGQILFASLLLGPNGASTAADNTYKYRQIVSGPGLMRANPAINNSGWVDYVEGTWTVVGVGDGFTNRSLMLNLNVATQDLNLNASGNSVVSNQTGPLFGLGSELIKGGLQLEPSSLLSTTSNPEFAVLGAAVDIDESNAVYFRGILTTGAEAVYKYDGTAISRLMGPGDVTPLGTLTQVVASEFSTNGNGDLATVGLTTSTGSGADDKRVYKVVNNTTIPVSQSLLAVGVETPSINDLGQVAYGFGSGLLDDYVLQVSDGTATDTRVPSGSGYTHIWKSSINNLGVVAFEAAVTNSPVFPDGIFTGPDPAANSVVKVGDTIPVTLPDGSTSSETIARVNLSSHAINDAGQIAFYADYQTTGGGAVGAIIRADAPGSTPENPLLPDPPTTSNPNFYFPCSNKWSPCRRAGIAVPGPGGNSVPVLVWFDPASATGYDFSAEDGAPNFAAVEPPPGIGDGIYDLYLFDDAQGIYVDSGIKISGGQLFSFVDDLGVPNGVSRFSLRGIEEDAMLDPSNPTAFVTGLSFVASSTTGKIVPLFEI